MKVPKIVIEEGTKLIKEVARKAYKVGFLTGVKKTVDEIAPYGGVLMHSTDPNARKIGSKLLHISKRTKNLNIF